MTNRNWVKKPWAGAFDIKIENSQYGETDPVIWGPSFGTAGSRVRIYPGKPIFYVWENHRMRALDWNWKRYPKDYATHGLKAEWAKKHVDMFPTAQEAIEFAESLMKD